MNYQPGLNNRQIKQKRDDEKSSRQPNDAQNLQEARTTPQGQNQFKQSQMLSSMPKPNDMIFPNGEKSAIDYTKKQINIAQVLSDFRNTANAIGAPSEIRGEVEAYLNLIQNQASKENPNTQIIQANLKNASQILDEYITQTLQKPSKVVENWVDTLFLQRIDYKIPTEEASLQASELADENVPETLEQPTEQEPKENAQSDFYVPLDAHLRSMFIQAKKYSAIDNKEKALAAFQNVVEYAEETGDSQTAAMAYYEQGKIFDEFDRVDDALYSYKRAAEDTQDNNIRARAHISMGKIYDDYVKFEPAVEHYCAAVSFAGESDNLNLQTKALSNLAKIHAGRYDKTNSFIFMDMAETAAEETNNERLKGITFASNAKCCDKLNEKARAIELYGKSAQSFYGIDYYEGLANDYAKAGDLMLEYGNKAKAKKLFSKAFIALQQCDNPELKQEVISKITSL